MSKKLIFFLTLFFILLFQIPIIKGFIIRNANEIKIRLNALRENFHTKYEEFLRDKSYIQRLESENKKLKYALVKLDAKCSCGNINILHKPSISFCEVISYAKLPDFSEVYLTYSKPFTSPRGLIWDGFAAGIAVKKYSNYTLGLLNSNKKTTYTVYIGKNKIPGIFYGKDNIIKFIPRFKPIKKGDLVITSGLDGVFYEGVKVGTIISVTQKKLYQTAKIKLFYNDLHPKYFYVVETLRSKLKIGGENGKPKH